MSRATPGNTRERPAPTATAVAVAELSVGGESEPGKQIGDFPGQFMFRAIDDAEVVVQRLQLVRGLGGLVFGDQQYADVET